MMSVCRAALLAALGLGLGCGKDDARPASPQMNDADGESPTKGLRPPDSPEDTPSVVFETDGSPSRVLVEVARKPREIQRGLMYRTHLPTDRGMLFLMGEDKIQTFWMKNTLIPLDIIFITRDMKVAGTVADAEPRTTSSRRVDKPSRYVLEVNAGWAASHKIREGTPVRFENLAE